jgi:hypothetical protein
MEASAQGAGTGEPQATREMPALGEQVPGPSPAAAQDAANPDAFNERPELFVGAAFAGGFLLAKFVKRFGR